MLGLLLWVAVAGSAVPEGVLPEVHVAALPEAWQQRAVARGEPPPALACRPWAEELVLCFTVPDGETRRYVTTRDLAAWEADAAALEAAAVAHVVAGLGPSRPQEVRVEGDPRTYLLSAEGDGLDQAGLFHPEALAARFGGQPFAVGVPARGVLIAFPLGDPELERIVAVGIRRAFESLEDPISPLVFTWSGGQWVPWGEARPDRPTSPSLERPR